MKRKALTAACAACTVGLLLSSSCRLDVEPSAVVEATLPDSPGQVLEEDAQPGVVFARLMDRRSTEESMGIEGPRGPVPGAWKWEGREATFENFGEYVPGTSYRLELGGTARDARGTAHPLSRSVRFFVGRGNGAAVTVLSMEPEGGSTLTDPHTPVTLTFSEPMDTRTVEDALLVYPELGCEATWDGEATVCTIAPTGTGWTGPRTYTLQVDGSAAARSGGMLSRPFEALLHSATSPDPLPPPETETVLLAWPPPFPATSPDVTALEEGETFLLRFSRPVDRESIDYAFSLDPYCPGSLYWCSDTECVFVPEPGSFFEIETEYFVRLDEGASAAGGGELENPFSFSFSGAVSPPHPVSVDGHPGDPFPVDLPHSSTVSITPSGLLGSYTLIWSFDLPVASESERARLQETVSIAPVFPPDLPYPSIVHHLWTDDLTLVSQCEGIGGGSEGRTCYYRLSFPSSGRGSPDSAETSLMLEYTP